MVTHIGIVAGKILDYLEEKMEPVSIDEMSKLIDEPPDLVNMALGWLIREDLIRVIRGHHKYLVRSKDVKSPYVFENMLGFA